MKRNTILFATVLGASILSCGVYAQQTELPTLEKALEISRRSGRPIFALAGRQT